MTPVAQKITEEDTLTIEAAMLGYSDAEDDALVSITITAIPKIGRLQLDGVDVKAGSSVTAQKLADGELVYHPATGLKADIDVSFSFRVSDGTTDSTAATLTITVTESDDAPTLVTYDNKITVSAGERLVLNEHINAEDVDTAASKLTYTAGGTMPGLLQKWDGKAGLRCLTGELSRGLNSLLARSQSSLILPAISTLQSTMGPPPLQRKRSLSLCGRHINPLRPPKKAVNVI